MRTVMLFFAMMALCLQAMPVALAHAPADAAAQRSGQTLIISLSHMVSDPASHYVKRIRIWRNGVQLAAQDFQRQSDASTQRLEISLEETAVKTGDVLEIEAFCSRFGSLKKTVTLE